MSRMTYMRSWKSHRLTSHTWLGLNPQIGRPLSRIGVPLVYFIYLVQISLSLSYESTLLRYLSKQSYLHSKNNLLNIHKNCGWENSHVDWAFFLNRKLIKFWLKNTTDENQTRNSMISSPTTLATLLTIQVFSVSRITCINIF
jgi:hypothetical protein